MSHIRMTNDGITYIRITKSCPTLADYKEQTKLIHEHFGDKMHLFVLNFKHTQPNTKKEIRDYMISEEYVQQTKAVAWLVNNSKGKMIGQLINSSSKPSYPFEIFSTEKEAKAWLLEQ